MKNVLDKTIAAVRFLEIDEKRRRELDETVSYFQSLIKKKETLNLNFICTHNSRRSHLAQIWAQIAAAYHKIDGIYCYSGGTEATAVFPMILETLKHQGLQVIKLSLGGNPVFGIKHLENNPPIIAFSKEFDHEFNPKSNFIALMTCSDADENCPVIFGANKRISMTYDDPKTFDNTPIQSEKYLERSLQIASEMFYIFAKL